MPVAVRIRQEEGGDRCVMVASIEADPVVPGNVLLRGVAGVIEEDAPGLVVVDWSVPAAAIRSYCTGDVREVGSALRTPTTSRPTAPEWTPGAEEDEDDPVPNNVAPFRPRSP